MAPGMEEGSVEMLRVRVGVILEPHAETDQYLSD